MWPGFIEPTFGSFKLATSNWRLLALY